MMMLLYRLIRGKESLPIIGLLFNYSLNVLVWNYQTHFYKTILVDFAALSVII